MTPSISAIVCTFNRKALVVDAVQALVDQDLPETDYEILVVDNNSTDGTREAVEARFSGVENLRIIHEEKQGLSPARNAGVRAARSPIAAFTDDDALVPSDWLRRFLALYAELDPKLAVIGGDMKPIFTGERPPWLIDELLRPLSAGLGWSTEPHYLTLHGHEWLCEVNSAYRIEPLLTVGGFPEGLGRVGENLVSGEGFVNIVLQYAGYPLYYDPTLVVRHRVPPNRMTREWFRRRMLWEGVSQYRAREYLEKRGIKQPVISRPLNVPCSPADWVRLFDDELDGIQFARALESIFHMGYVLGTQNLTSDAADPSTP